MHNHFPAEPKLQKCLIVLQLIYLLLLRGVVTQEGALLTKVQEQNGNGLQFLIEHLKFSPLFVVLKSKNITHNFLKTPAECRQLF